MSESPVTRQEMRETVDAAEGRSVELVELVTTHFDKRITDSERVLTWRMIAVGGMTGVLTSALDVIARGDQSGVARTASAIFGHLT